MAKNKDRAHSPQSSASGEEPAASPANVHVPLLDEVQAFLDQRAELLKKVLAEIAATEKRLVELKQTAAMLSGTGKAAGHPERKQRKPKVKSSEHAPEADTPPNEAQG